MKEMGKQYRKKKGRCLICGRGKGKMMRALRYKKIIADEFEQAYKL